MDSRVVLSAEELLKDLPAAKALITEGRLDEAFEALLIIEKGCRQAQESGPTSEVAVLIVSMFLDKQKWSQANEALSLLCKKRGQLKKPISDMVNKSIEYLDRTPDKETKLKLIRTLSQLTEGKIFVEVERARLVAIEANMNEEEGNIKEAANLLQEVQVETFGAMDKIEKTEYILNQMRLMLLKEDFIRVQIISKKIAPKLLDSDDLRDIKIRYYKYLVELYLHDKDYLNVAKSLYHIYDTQKLKKNHIDNIHKDEKNIDMNIDEKNIDMNIDENNEECMNSLESYILFLIMSPVSDEAQQLLVKIQTLVETKHPDQCTIVKGVLDGFLTHELMVWPLSVESYLKDKHEVFTDSRYEGGSERWERLHERVVQKNIIVLARYYDRITMDRLCEMIAMDRQGAENQISELVSSKCVKAKLHRPLGYVTFGDQKEAPQTLNSWSNSIKSLLGIVEESCHLIYKEQMVHAAQAKRAQLAKS
eukprot:GHVL01010160.1.p1 GENE.GHVL01010160.1~~GHVL01010160.1.p1  ORF type:complete len:478 (+),score=109.44 GHVL01010160.1:83-1516(+)